MKIVVITGSTRGIGRGLAVAFLERRHAVVISGRSASSVDPVVAELSESYDPACLLAQPCDVTDYAQVEELWRVAVRRFGRVDIWINNAGMGNAYRPVWQQNPADMQSVVKVNLLGVMNGTHCAYNQMLAQGGGEIYNMYGHGSTGRKQDGLAVYGSTKYGVTYFTEAFIEEISRSGTPVIIGSLSPGMIVTDLLVDAFDTPEEFEQSKRILSILSDRAETVTPWLVKRILTNTKQGISIKWLTKGKLMWRFLTAPFSQRDLFSDED